MDQKDFLTSSVLAGLASFSGYPKTNLGKCRTENIGPDVDDRLDQGPFTIDNISSWQVVMTTTPGTQKLKNYGMGLVTYVIDEAGSPKKEGESLRRSIENLVALPLGDKIYLRLNWKDLQQNPGELNPSKAWEIALEMFRTQSEHWSEIPLTTNTQPDVSNVGNDALTEETFRTNNWLRTDTIFIENQQIDTIATGLHGWEPHWKSECLMVKTY